MRTADYDYKLPPELVAQNPAAQRDASRLLVCHRNSDRIEHRLFSELTEYLHPGDVLVLNNSRVIPARLRGTNAKTGGQFELLLLEEAGRNDWWVMLRPGKRAREGTQVQLRSSSGKTVPITATVTAKNEEGHRRVCFTGVTDIRTVLEELGEVPLPPYIERQDRAGLEPDRERYQTVFAHAPGSVAAPTAGLHFTEDLLGRVRRAGVAVCFVTLHVGLGTFAPVKSEEITAHVMHEERFELSAHAARTINQARAGGGRVMAVGTTTLRVLETLGKTEPTELVAYSGRTRIFIHPPYDFRLVDALLTNFHLPRSTLLMLVSAFAAPGTTTGREKILGAYGEAILRRYRFFSYGDAMLLL